ncbi:MAG: glycosyltransferase family 2 protein, partial [Lachnospiraceae bacterium]|nr:glycosyltransferase family 2 protein [Lachnospiraceae bacterium]
CIESIFRQTRLPDEVIIGDDGSKDDTRLLIEEMAKISPIPLIHVWQEDDGYRLSTIRNKSAAKSSGEYLIETDGDIILHPRFVEDHERMASHGKYLKGSRTLLSPSFTESICVNGLVPKIPFWSSGILKKRDTAIRSHLIASFLKDRFKKGKAIGLGCNMSFWKSDFIAINGYDESFVGWGKEDDDLAHRLDRYGVVKRDLRCFAIAYHLWHNESSRHNHGVNESLMKLHDYLNTTRITNGVNKYMNA